MKYKIVVDKQSRTNPSSEKKEYEVDIEELRVKGDVYDSLVITKNEDYVMRRLSLSELQVLSVLEEPIKQPLPDLNIELFEGDNYIYLLDMTGNKFYAEYIVKNDFTELYVTTNEMNSAINQSASQIESSVNQKLTGYSTTEEMNASINMKADEITSKVSQTYETKENATTKYSEIKQTTDSISLQVGGKLNEKDFTGANIMLAVNNDSSSAQIEADKVNLNGYVTMTNLSTAGKTTINGGNITTGTIDASKATITNINADNIKSGTITGRAISGGTITGSTINNGNSFNVDTNGNVAIKDNGTEGKLKITNGGNFNTTHYSFGSHYEGPNGYVGIEADFAYSGGSIFVAPSQSESSNYTLIQNGKIDTSTLTQRSLEIAKKNFEKLQSGLDIIKNIDIYKYNLKSEDDNTKKHIGFVIGDNYKYSKEVTSDNNDGVDIYSFVAVCCKAIQEQQEQIEQQNNLIQSLVERIEKLEAK